MSTRHLSRSIALQSLFEWDFNNYKKEKALKITKQNIEEFAPGMSEVIFVNNLVSGVIDKQNELDDIIKKAATEWPLEKISIVDRNSLRMGLYELLYSNRNEVPAKVAINEAIEIAKTFGGENSGKFINGVMGTVYKLLGEPGKDDESKRKITDPSKLPIESLGGAVVYRNVGKTYYLALVHDVFGYWTLSKGHIDSGENAKDGTIREIKEELGIDVSIIDTIGENEYIASDPEKGKIRKHVYYFLAEAKDEELKLVKSGGLLEAKWFPASELTDLKMYDDILPIVTKAINLMQKKNK